MGASEPLRWHSWQRSWKIGATSLANVTAWAVSDAPAEVAASAPNSAAGSVTKAANARSLAGVITRSLNTPSTNRQSSISLAVQTDNVKGGTTRLRYLRHTVAWGKLNGLSFP